MSRNVLYIVIGALLVAVSVFALQLYRERNREGVEISVGERGISIQKR